MDLDNRLSQVPTETSIEGHDPTASIDNTPRHETRSTRNGRADVNYSQKYHPMDEVTRPKRAHRITGSRSLSASASRHEPETSDEDEPELYSASETSDSTEPDEDEEAPTERTPDPRAVRQSARAEAKKSVNYSRKHHPQDGAIPGTRCLAKRKKRSAPKNKPAKKKVKAQTSDDRPIILSSDKVIDSDSENEAEGDQPPIIHSSPAKVSAGEPQDNSPGSQSPQIDDGDTASSDDELPPEVPHGESSLNEAENIIQGKHIARSQRIKQATCSNKLSEAGDTAAEDEDFTFENMSIKEIGASIETFLDNVETLDDSKSDSASDEHDQSDEPDTRPRQATSSVALVTPASMGTSVTPSQSCTQPKVELMINRPYLSSQPVPSSCRETQHPEQLKTLDEHPQQPAEPGLSSQPSNVAAEEGDDFAKEKQIEASRQALRESSEQAARVARAKQVTDRLSSEPSSLDHDTSGSSGGKSNSASRQASRDTLPDDPSSTYFEEAMEVTVDSLQHKNDEDSPRPSPSGYSELPVSDRERSDACAPQERPNLDLATSGASNHENVQPSNTVGSSLLRGDAQIAKHQQECQMSDMLSNLVEEPGQAVAASSSKDSMFLKPSSGNLSASQHAAERGDLQKLEKTAEEPRMHQPGKPGGDGDALRASE